MQAGQSLAYDALTGKYRVLEGGRSIPRDQIETMPGVDELLDFGILSLTSDAHQAEVRIDGRYRGLTPLVVLVPPGPHSLHLSKDGYAAYDTMVAVREGLTSRMAATLPALQQPPAPVTAKAAARKAPAPRTSPRQHPAEAAPPGPKGESVVQLFHRADEAQAGDWRLAIMLYAQVLEHPHATGMRKEAALFSIARLRADHEEEKSRARDEFLQYLALYPDGAFAGESWMRLSSTCRTNATTRPWPCSGKAWETSFTTAKRSAGESTPAYTGPMSPRATRRMRNLSGTRRKRARPGSRYP